ncbi:MAG: hypothetical protein GY761_13140 [Hyphomicrobiales bacterium]|nr:hypothetical protein [Hyphomicrobiales bacterium]
MPVYSGTQDQWKGESVNGVTDPDNNGELWTVAKLADIGLEKYVSPEPEPVDPLALSITRMQFKAILRINDLFDAVKTAIEAIPNANTKAVVLSKFEENDRYNRDDPLFTTLGATLGISSDEIDAMWLQALGIE